MDSRKIVYKETAIVAIGVGICVGLMLAVFALLGAVDRVFGNRFGLGQEFENGMIAMGSMVPTKEILAKLLRRKKA